MIGSAKITYTNENVCQLVRKDLVDKFGNRELANYNLYLPGVIRAKAVVDTFPDPTVKVTSVEEQLIQMGILPKPQVPRQADSVSASVIDAGAPISYNFDVKQRKMVITGGPISYTTGDDGTKGHWYLINVNFPVGLSFEAGNIISYTQNGVPKSYVLTSDDIDNGGLTLTVDAKYTTMDLNILWDDAYATEKISTVCNASLAETAIDKIPEFPTEPKFEFTYPTGVVIDSNVQVDVDLDIGKN